MTVRDDVETLSEVIDTLDSVLDSEHVDGTDSLEIGLAVEHLESAHSGMKSRVDPEPNTVSDIPEGEQMPAHEHLDLPELPGTWEWTSVNRAFNNKVNLYFESGDLQKPGNWMGEIDNYVEDGDEQWGLHIRVIEPTPKAGETRPAQEPATTAESDTLEDAIDTVPAHIATHYEVSDE